MALYDIFMAPIERFILRQARKELMGMAAKDVLEIGTGSGINFKYYNFAKIERLTSIDLDYPAKLVQQYPNISFTTGNIEALPFGSGSFDCVVESLVLCSVDSEKSIQEIKRVLKTGGTFIFIEHVRPRGNIGSKIADIINPLWSKAANGCNLNRDTDIILQEAGFHSLNIHKKGVFRYGYAKL